MRLFVLGAVLALGFGAAQANVYGFVDGDRVSVVISDTPPEDSRYILYRKHLPGQFTDVPDDGAALEGGRYGSHILAAAAETKVDAALIHAVISVESGYNPSARSSAGAVGLMQLMPATAKRYGVKNRLDPAQNIQGGARYLRDLQVLFGDNLQLVLAAYNAGEQAVMKHGRRIPPYRETAAYVPRVIQLYRKFRPAN
ncbi:MAG: lytic transglycosylase domain-containing protein [Betaproteobacteria bacterium]